jgi:hypothetical protein
VALIVGEDKMQPYGRDGHVRSFDAERARGGGSWVMRMLAGGSGGGAGGANGGNEDAWARLSWALSRDAEEAVTAAVTSLRALGDDLDLQVVSWTAYGKDFVSGVDGEPGALMLPSNEKQTADFPSSPISLTLPRR